MTKFSLNFCVGCEPFFFLTGNEITKVEGLEGLHDLRELVLDRNKIKIISDYAFANQWNLQELHMEENRLREVAPLGCLENLQRLYLGSNRIQVSLLLDFLHSGIQQTNLDICVKLVQSSSTAT